MEHTRSFGGILGAYIEDYVLALLCVKMRRNWGKFGEYCLYCICHGIISRNFRKEAIDDRDTLILQRLVETGIFVLDQSLG